LDPNEPQDTRLRKGRNRQNEISMSLKAILFDLDGTLLDTLADLADAANRVLAGAGLPTHGRDAYRRFIGDGSRMLITRALPAHQREPQTIDAMLTAFKADYGRHWKTATCPYPGIPELLDELVRRRIPRGVVTNKPQPFAEGSLAYFFPDAGFAIVRGQHGTRPIKPHPAPALEAAARLGAAPPECLLVGDSGVDMQTARAAGMLPIGAAWGFRSVEELTENGAAGIAFSPIEVLEWFDRRGAP
jgi:phosphoglycolate phosphatase